MHPLSEAVAIDMFTFCDFRIVIDSDILHVILLGSLSMAIANEHRELVH